MEVQRIRKAINFDLDTNALRKYYCQETGQRYTQAYTDIQRFMTHNGFVHRQGSGYVSSEPIDKIFVSYLILKMRQQFPWLTDCVKAMDVTDIGEQYDLLPELLKNNEQTYDQIKAQYSAGSSYDGAIIIDYDTMLRDHPELISHNKARVDMQTEPMKENHNHENDRNIEWDQER